MGYTFYLNWEPAVMVWLQQKMGPVLTALASALSVFGEELVLIGILGFIYWVYNKKAGVFIGVNLMAGLALNVMVKNLVLRQRPYMVHAKIQCLKPVDASADIYNIAVQGYSFPSAHAMNNTILYGSLAIFARKKWMAAVAVILPLLVGISRVMLGVHYPTDVMAGWFGGVLVLFCLTWLQQKVRRPILFPALVVLSLPGLLYCRTTDYYTTMGLMIGFCLAIPFEARYVRFENLTYTGGITILWAVLRTLGGLVAYLILNQLLKLPFSAEFLAKTEPLPLMVRIIRYTIVTFLTIGVYPMVFKYIEKRKKA